MFFRLIISLVLFFTLNTKEIFASPIDVPKPNLLKFPFQLINSSDLVAYQGYGLKDNLDSTRDRKKRFVDDLLEVLSLLDDYFDDEEDDASSKEEGGERDGITDKDNQQRCRSCTVSFNTVNQHQQLNHGWQPSLLPLATHVTEILAPTEQSLELERKRTTKYMNAVGAKSIDAKKPPAAPEITSAAKESKASTKPSASAATELLAVTEPLAVIEPAAATKPLTATEPSAAIDTPATALEA